MKYLLFAIFIISAFAFLFSPISASAKSIWAGTSCVIGSDNKVYEGPVKPCSFCDAVVVAINVIDFLFKASIAIGVFMMVWGAIQLIIAGGSEERIGKGKKTITAAVIGIAIALAAWVIVGTLLSFLTGNPTFAWNQVTCKP